jgi:hypothetical protein
MHSSLNVSTPNFSPKLNRIGKGVGPVTGKQQPLSSLMHKIRRMQLMKSPWRDGTIFKRPNNNNKYCPRAPSDDGVTAGSDVAQR